MKIYVDGKFIPEKCNDCKFIGHYEDGIYSRNPHCCCELYWDLCKDEIRVDKNSRDERCPLQPLTDHDKQVRKEVLDKVMKTIDNYCDRHRHKGDICISKLHLDFKSIMTQIEKENKW